MNWSHGFIRLWIVFTAVWVLGWAVGLFVNWPDFAPASYVVSKDYELRNVDLSDRDAIREAEERGVIRKKVTSDGDTFYWSAAKPEGEKVGARMVQELRAQRSRDTRELLLGGAIGIVSLPAFFLLCGLAISWIIQGFRVH